MVVYLALWAGDGFGIQRLGELPWTLARREGFEDSLHDDGFRVVDFSVTADQFAIVVILLDHVIAKAKPTRRLARLDPALQAAACLVGEVLQEQRVHRAFKADMERADFTFRQCHDLDAGEAQPLENASDILLIP